MNEYPHPQKARWRKVKSDYMDWQYTIDYYPAVIGTIKEVDGMFHLTCRIQDTYRINDASPVMKTETLEKAKSIVESIWVNTSGVTLFITPAQQEKLNE